MNAPIDAAPPIVINSREQLLYTLTEAAETHLALVGNLMTALGGVAHFNRPNFPIGIGYHPADLKVRLAPFNRATLQHFVHLERPEGSDEPDGDGFVAGARYERGLNGLRLAPSVQDYLTVGHLYRSLEAVSKPLSIST